MYDQMKEKGLSVSTEAIAAVVSSTEFRATFGQLLDPRVIIDPYIDAHFQNMNDRAGAWIADIISRFGILSLSETALSQPMWGLYSGSGKGFVVGFDAKSDFFCRFKDTGEKCSLLRKVRYADDKVDDFWNDPYCLFLVKGTAWSFEREWRVLRELTECDRTSRPDGEQLFTVDVPKATIKEILFGYNYNGDFIQDDIAKIVNISNNIKVSRIGQRSDRAEFVVTNVD
jgi:hypothetical protein